ncbi:MAG TPA: alpha/beta hydrolase [Blastocatellia bacterium]|nr:alpha/beta hydrolase [Blastocatellia bacterium]
MKAQVNGININYRDEGSGQAVIFIHGFPLNQTMWDSQVAALKDRFRVITVDLRGFGESDVPEGPYTMTQMADDVRELMRALSLDTAVFVGLSMGGYVSLAFYRKYPEAIKALVLADTRAVADDAEGRERRFKSAERALALGSSAIADDMVGVALGATTLKDRPEVVRRMREIAESGAPEAIASAQRGMAERLDSRDLLAGIDFPVLVICGEEDTLTPLAQSEALNQAIRGSKLVVIPKAGHLSNMEQGELFNAALIGFLDSIEHRKRD